MNRTQLSAYIGNIDDKLVQQAEQIPNYAMQRRHKRRKQFLASAAVLALMFSSFRIGAMAFAREIIVEVPAEQEMLELEGMGLTLLFPDSWKGQYAVEKNGRDYIVYHLQSKKDRSDRIDPWDGGVLFTIVCYDEAMTEEQFLENGLDFTAYRYILSTNKQTYILHYASDVQYDLHNEEQKTAYTKLISEIDDIQFVVDVFEEERSNRDL